MANTTHITKAQRVLEYIASEPDGMSLKQIQTFILKMNGTQKWMDKGYLALNPKTGEIERTHKGRGYWCDFLYGTNAYRWSQVGFLSTHCVRMPSGKWKVTEPIVGPFRGKKTKSLDHNRDREQGAYQRYIASLPQCPGCNRPLHKFDERSPDKQAHITMWSGAYSGDCKDRVWRPEVMEIGRAHV